MTEDEIETEFEQAHLVSDGEPLERPETCSIPGANPLPRAMDEEGSRGEEGSGERR